MILVKNNCLFISAETSFKIFVEYKHTKIYWEEKVFYAPKDGALLNICYKHFLNCLPIFQTKDNTNKGK